MEIVQNKALLLGTRNPDKITQVIKKAKVVGERDGVSRVLVHWDLPNAFILRNLGFKKVPSTILKDYDWPGLYQPFAHQKDTASFLTLHRKAFCFNEQGCVDSDTEYLSPTGWVKISEYAGGQVAQFHPDTGMVEFVEPDGYLKKPCETMVHFKTKYGIDQMLSLEHRMLIHDNASSQNKWAVMSAEEMLYRHNAFHAGEKLARSTDMVGFSHASCPAVYARNWGEGLPLTEEELRLQVAVIADGHFSSGSNRCVVRLKKSHKIERMSNLLLEAGVDFDARKQDTATAKGFVVFTFEAPIRVKEFDERFYQCSQQQVDTIYDEVLRWDGCYRKGGRLGEFSSVSKASADFIQMVFNSKGHIARITEDTRRGKYRNGVCYVVCIRERSNGLLSYKSNEETAALVQSTDGYKYCFTVPTSFLLFRRNGCVFASGNTGKTNSVIWASDYLLNIGVIRRVLIICPLSIMDCAWRSDLFKTVMHRRVGIAHHTKREKRVEVINSKVEYVIINPDGVETVQNELARGHFNLIVCDEATFLQNPKTDRWKAINSLIGPDTWLWLLTGTPAAQSPEHAYGLARIINPGSVPSYAGAWKDKVMTKIGQFKWIPRPEAQQTVHNVLQPAIRYTKEECLDLPEMLYSTREVEMTAQQKKYYDKLRKDMLIQAAGEEVSAVNAAVQMNKLLQLSGGSVYSDTGEVIEFDVSHKLNALLETIEEASHKTLVFCTYQHSIDLVQRFLTGHKISSEAIHGGVSAKKRTDIFDRFQKSPDPQVLIIQPQSAAHGVTLTAANTVCWFSPTTSAESYLQANARVHRQGQRNPCLVVHLCSSPVEKKLYRALEDRTLAQGDLLGMFKNFLGGDL